MEKHFQTITDDELKEFNDICTKNGIQAKEFTLTEHDVIRPQVEGNLYNLQGKITLLRNGHSKTYNTGNLKDWTSEFEDDLKQGFFK
ncbi:hypothetical protein [Legionella yabuuchiae]|uniref:hypothetical protein n=1 Tax=Legionella yabuuchiae TaxID=376727 RepID=UPI00105597D8|nr:hypothetical protein [Legionella yabuuchiae]